MLRRYRRSTTKVMALLTLVGILFVGAWFFAGTARTSAASEDAGRLLTVYDRGTEQVFLTQAATIGDALREEGFLLDPRDVVEPALDETMVASDYHVNIYRARPVTVVDGVTRQRIMTAYQSAEKIVADAGIALNPEDNTSLRRSDDIIVDGAGLQLVIDRATPVVLDLFGAQVTLRTQASTLGELLIEKKITLTDVDRTSLPLETPIAANMSARVWREGRQTVSVEEVEQFAVERTEDADRPIGYKEVTSTGKNGMRTVTYEIVVEGGVEIARQEIARVVTVPSVPQQEIVGSKVVLSVNFSADKAAIMTAGGVAPDDQQYAAYIINNENALWCAIRWQRTNGCAETYYEKFAGAESSDQIGYGLCQATPASKMDTAGADWRTNVVTQMKWCASYALSRYYEGSPYLDGISCDGLRRGWQCAYKFKIANGWW